MKMKKGKILIVSCIFIAAIFMNLHLHVNAAGKLICSGGIHVMTNVSYQTYVTTYDHASQYGTCHVRIEEIKKITKCQCGALMTSETDSRSETHSQPH